MMNLKDMLFFENIKMALNVRQLLQELDDAVQMAEIDLRQQAKKMLKTHLYDYIQPISNGYHIPC